MLDGSWFGRLGRIVSLLQAVYRTEIGDLWSDLGDTGRRGLRLLLWLGGALALLFWSIGALLFGLGAALAPRLGVAAAAASVGGALLVLAALIVIPVVRRARTLETPAATVRRRFDSHLAWLRQEVVGDAGGSPGGEGEPRRTRWREGRAAASRGPAPAGEEESW